MIRLIVTLVSALFAIALYQDPLLSVHALDTLRLVLGVFGSISISRFVLRLIF